MIGHIKIKERGSTPRRMKRQLNANMKSTWLETGTEFHTEMRPDRFTDKHAREANYANRTKKYTERKRKSSRLGGGPGQALPLVYTGESRRAAGLARISSTSKGVNVRYPGLRKLNLTSGYGQARPSREFRRVVPREQIQLAKFYDTRLDRRFASDNAASTETVS